jgi:hypothetical protein
MSREPDDGQSSSASRLGRRGLILAAAGSWNRGPSGGPRLIAWWGVGGEGGYGVVDGAGREEAVMASMEGGVQVVAVAVEESGKGHGYQDQDSIGTLSPTLEMAVLFVCFFPLHTAALRPWHIYIGLPWLAGEAFPFAAIGTKTKTKRNFKKAKTTVRTSTPPPLAQGPPPFHRRPRAASTFKTSLVEVAVF